MSAVKKEITPSEASEQKGILQDLYKKELFGKYSKANGFDKAYMIEKVDELFQKYKVNRENMSRLEKKMEKQFDANYTKHFQMKEVQRISDKKDITKSKRLLVVKDKPGQKQSEQKKDEKTKQPSIQADSQKKSADQNQQRSSEISEKKSEKVASSVTGTLSGSQVCDLKGLWEKENAKLRTIKLQEQENRRKELDAQENNKKQLKEKEKKEDEEYMRQVRKEERHQVRLDREKAKLREKEMEEEKARIEKQKAEKFQIKAAEADYDNQKHKEMMGILEKENKIEAAKVEEQKREMRKLFRNQIRDMKNQTKKQINEREEEKTDEKERMRVYAEMEEKRQQTRLNEVNKREQHAKDVMNAYHQKYGVDIAEKEKEDQFKMFRTITEQEKKADQEDDRRKQLILNQRGLLKSTLERQSQEKIQRDRNYVLNEYAKDEDMLKITRQAIKQDELLQSNRKQYVKKYASYLDQQMQERRIQSAKKMSSNELQINKPILKGIVVQSQGELKELNFDPHLKRAVSQKNPFRSSNRVIRKGI